MTSLRLHPLCPASVLSWTPITPKIFLDGPKPQLPRGTPTPQISQTILVPLPAPPALPSWSCTQRQPPLWYSEQRRPLSQLPITHRVQENPRCSRLQSHPQSSDLWPLLCSEGQDSQGSGRRGDEGSKDAKSSFRLDEVGSRAEITEGWGTSRTETMRRKRKCGGKRAGRA